MTKHSFKWQNSCKFHKRRKVLNMGGGGGQGSEGGGKGGGSKLFAQSVPNNYISHIES